MGVQRKEKKFQIKQREPLKRHFAPKFEAGGSSTTSEKKSNGKISKESLFGSKVTLNELQNGEKKGTQILNEYDTVGVLDVKGTDVLTQATSGM